MRNAREAKKASGHLRVTVDVARIGQLRALELFWAKIAAELLTGRKPLACSIRLSQFLRA
jgi:hypothetical protein